MPVIAAQTDSQQPRTIVMAFRPPLFQPALASGARYPDQRFQRLAGFDGFEGVQDIRQGPLAGGKPVGADPAPADQIGHHS